MPRSKFVVLVAICLCASTMSLTPDSLVPEVLVETLPYDVAAEATSFIEARKGDNKACIKEANLALKSVTDSVTAQNTASAGLSDGSTCALAGKQLIASAQSAADQASKDASQATSALSNAASAPVERKFPFTSSSDSMKDSQCKQLFQSSSWTAAKAAYASAQSEVIKTGERKRLSAEALTQAEADAAVLTSKCLCEAQKAHAAFVAEVATASSSFERLWKVSQKILCLTGETCQDTAVPAFVTQKQLTADAKQAKCGPTAKEKAEQGAGAGKQGAGAGDQDAKEKADKEKDKEKADMEKADKTTLNSVTEYNTRCSDMRGKTLQHLDRQHLICHKSLDKAGVPHSNAMTRFEMGLLGSPQTQQQGRSCSKDGKALLYSYWCAKLGTVAKFKYIKTSCEKAENEGLQFLDRQFFDCGQGNAIRDFMFSDRGCESEPGKMRYKGNCFTSVTSYSTTTHYTKCSEAKDKTLEHLDQQNVKCPDGQAIRGFGLVKGNCENNDMQYKIYCAQITTK